jgi:hypothetical protein
MRIASGGNVLVGSTVDNGYKFKVVGGNANGFLLDNDGSQFTQLLLQRNSTTNTGGDILIDGTQFSISDSRFISWTDDIPNFINCWFTCRAYAY